MNIFNQTITQAVYFTKKPPEFFIPAVSGGSVTDREMRAASLFYENHMRLLGGKGGFKDTEIIKSVQDRHGCGPIMVTRKIDSLLLLPANVN